MAFGKPGRPPEDRLLRKREIFEAVAPLLLDPGARKISMQDAAHAACLSIGGLYHYFPTKRDLVLHGLDPQARRRICEEQRDRLAALPREQWPSLTDICVETSLRIITLMRPSVIAARDLGGETFQDSLDPGWTSDVDELAENIGVMLPGEHSVDLVSLARVIRRVMIAALVERNVDLDVVRTDLHKLIAAQVGGAPVPGAA